MQPYELIGLQAAINDHVKTVCAVVCGEVSEELGHSLPRKSYDKIANAIRARFTQPAIKADDAELKLIDERDEAQEAMSQAYYLVVGVNPEWSNKFGYREANLEIEKVIDLLKSSTQPAIKEEDEPPLRDQRIGSASDGDIWPGNAWDEDDEKPLLKERMTAADAHFDVDERNAGAESFAKILLADDGSGEMTPGPCADALAMVRGLKDDSGKAALFRELECLATKWLDAYRGFAGDSTRRTCANELRKLIAAHKPATKGD